MILKIVRADSGQYEYSDCDNIIADLKAKPLPILHGMRSGKNIYDMTLDKGDFAYIMEHGKTVDSFEG